MGLIKAFIKYIIIIYFQLVYITVFIIYYFFSFYFFFLADSLLLLLLRASSPFSLVLLKYMKKNFFFIVHNFYIKNLSIFLAPPKKAWLLCGCFLREKSSEIQNSKRFRFSMSVATVRTRIIIFMQNKKKAAVEIFFSKNKVFLSDFGLKK